MGLQCKALREVRVVDIERDMIFRGNRNGREVQILSANEVQVVYRDLKYGTVFTVGRLLFENLDITRVKPI